MSDPAKPAGGDAKPAKEKMKPGTIFALLLAIGIGGGIALWALMTGFASGAAQIGFVQNHYPAVITGIITFVLVVGAIVAGMSKKGDGH